MPLTLNLHDKVQHQKDFYDEYWKDFRAFSSYKIQRVIWIISTLLKIRSSLPSPEPKILDMGCGDGRLASFWKEVTGAELHGLDLSPRAVMNARNRYPFVNYLEGNATDSPYEDETFDLIVSQELIEHIENQRAFIAECGRILKRNGYLILTTPNKYFFDRREGGNYSGQPIENIVDKAQLFSLVCPDFVVRRFETIIWAAGDYGAYRLLANR